MRYWLIILSYFTVQADQKYVPYHTSHFRVYRDQQNTVYDVELPVEAYAIDDHQLSVPPVLVAPKPTTYEDDDNESEDSANGKTPDTPTLNGE